MNRNKPSTTRAELLRERRDRRELREKYKLRKKQNPRRASSIPRHGKGNATYGFPPIMVRDEERIYKTKRKKYKKLKRRFDVSLSQPGAEIRLPSLPIFRFGWRFVSGTFVVMIIFLLYFLWSTPSYRITELDLFGVERISRQDITSSIGLIDQPIFFADPIQVIDDLGKNFPELVNISVHITFPARIMVYAEERTPILSWTQDEATIWIDEYGIPFPPRGESEKIINVLAEASPPIALIESEGDFLANNPKPFMSPDMVMAVQAIADQIPQSSPVVYDPLHGLGWQDSRGWQVYFGMSEYDFEMKLHIYETLAVHLSQSGIQPALISVEHVHAPYYRLER